MSTYKLRPHHSLCIAFYEGKGYSAEFIKNMTAAIQQLNEGSYVTLTLGEDIICKACPNRIGSFCEQEDKVRGYDERLLEICGLRSCQELSWKVLKNLVNHHVIKQGKIKDVCRDCKWGDICYTKAESLIIE